MFKITYLVEDKHLAKAMHAVTSIALNLEVVPVINAMLAIKGKNKEVRQEQASTSLKGRLIDWIHANAGARLTSDELRAQYEKLGGTPSALNGSMMSELIKTKRLKRISRGQFTAQ